MQNMRAEPGFHGSLNERKARGHLAYNVVVRPTDAINPKIFKHDTSRYSGTIRPIVYICDHDVSSSQEIASMLGDVGYVTKWYGSPMELLNGIDRFRNSCVLAEAQFVEANGLDLLAQLRSFPQRTPVVFMTAAPDFAFAVDAMKAGAVDLLAKPLRDQLVLGAVKTALSRDADRRRKLDATSDIRVRFERLSRRERQVLKSVVSGSLNKQTANELRITEVTVKLHRRAVMNKMNAKSLADLVRKWEALIRVSPQWTPHDTDYE
jgi:FixJ family two-component response regulator